MKAIIFTFAILFFCTSNLICQENKVDLSRRFAVDVYSGGPNLRALFAETFEVISNFYVDSFSVDRVIPPSGIRAEYFLKDFFSIGMTGMYDQYNANYQQTGKLYTVQRIRFRALFDFGFHLGNSDKIDNVLTLSFGPKFKQSRYFIDNVSTSKEDFAEIMDIGGINFVPVAARFNYTFRYYFTPNLGFHFGAGLGGPMIQLGLSFKVD